MPSFNSSMNREPANWDDYRVFAAIVAEGSLSAAARRLKLSQPTMGRRLQALEQAMGAKLLDRVAGATSGWLFYDPVAVELAMAAAATNAVAALPGSVAPPAVIRYWKVANRLEQVDRLKLRTLATYDSYRMRYKLYAGDSGAGVAAQELLTELFNPMSPTPMKKLTTQWTATCSRKCITQPQIIRQMPAILSSGRPISSLALSIGKFIRSAWRFRSKGMPDILQ